MLRKGPRSDKLATDLPTGRQDYTDIKDIKYRNTIFYIFWIPACAGMTEKRGLINFDRVLLSLDVSLS